MTRGVRLKCRPVLPGGLDVQLLPEAGADKHLLF